MAKSPSQVAETLGGLGRLTELRQRLLFVLVALIIYRIGTFIPVPGVNPQALMQFMNSQQGTIIDVFKLVACGLAATGCCNFRSVACQAYVTRLFFGTEDLKLVDARLKQTQSRVHVGIMNGELYKPGRLGGKCFDILFGVCLFRRRRE